MLGPGRVFGATRVVALALLGLSVGACASTGPAAFETALRDEQDIDDPEDRARLLAVGQDYCGGRDDGFDLEVALHGPAERWPTQADSLRQQRQNTEAVRVLVEDRLCSR